MKFTITKQRVTAHPRALKSNWTILPTVDMIMATTPWQYLDNWTKSDRGPEETLAKLNERMQNRWPGKYRIVEKEVRSKEHMYKILKWDFEFDSPRDETWFRMQYA